MLAFDLGSLMQMAADFEFRKTYKAQNVETENLSLSERKKDFNRMTGGPQTPRGVQSSPALTEVKFIHKKQASQIPYNPN